ncbi:MAG: aminotransferase class I/II-fold pyridoxal phosphate-dependent enzyme [Planctomycetota bacterium]
MKIGTRLAQAGSRWDTRTGAVSMPIHQCATFRHPGLGQSTGFDYSRTANPTRAVLDETMAALDGGARGGAFGSGLAAIDAVLRLFASGDRIVVTEDLYGGTFRLLEKCHRGLGVEAVFVDTTDLVATRAALADDRVKGLLVEVPSNPLLKVADVAALVELAHARGALLIVDNTFLTPVLMCPLALGADIVVYSGSKYLAGHNDVIAGLTVARTAALGERIAFIQNAAGGILGPMDAWLLLRGLKTLALRLQRQEANARVVAEFLGRQPHVTRVRYPGLAGDPGHAVMRRQAAGFGGMIAFEVDDPGRVPVILAGVKVFLFAESLGGTESLITFPAVQTHADVTPAVRDRLGINDRLLRLSIGIEDPADLVDDLAAVLA